MEYGRRQLLKKGIRICGINKQKQLNMYLIEILTNVEKDGKEFTDIGIESINLGNQKKIKSYYNLFKNLENSGQRQHGLSKTEIANSVEIDSLMHLIQNQNNIATLKKKTNQSIKSTQNMVLSGLNYLNLSRVDRITKQRIVYTVEKTKKLQFFFCVSFFQNCQYLIYNTNLFFQNKIAVIFVSTNIC
ncbi:unnamed protein product [Paramecium pentaurelia]|uniref:Uncharacterized protein n=1 Tax=Paramecium pentaurelia TaxID=43138 RepID=A0A8S1VVJ5_9CILI|nr:unnamed protein product [Paramecium pentaurelia]